MKKKARKNDKQKKSEIPFYVREISKEAHRNIFTVFVLCAFTAGAAFFIMEQRNISGEYVHILIFLFETFVLMFCVSTVISEILYKEICASAALLLTIISILCTMGIACLLVKYGIKAVVFIALEWGAACLASVLSYLIESETDYKNK